MSRIMTARGLRRGVLVGLALVLLLAGVMSGLGRTPVVHAAPITISNGIPAGDPDHLSMEILPGSASRTLLVGTDEVLFQRFGVLDLGAEGVFTLGDGGFPPGIGSEPELVAPNVVRTTATINVLSGQVDVTITTAIFEGSSYVLTEYDVSADFDLTGSRLFEYVDLDVKRAGANSFSFSGSIDGNDLVMSQSRGGVTVDRSDPGQTATGFATDFFSALRTNILAGGFDPPKAGDIQAVFGDITSALEYELGGQDSKAVTAIGTSVPTELSKADILGLSGVPGKSIDKAQGLRNGFNQKSNAAENAGQKNTEVCHVGGNGTGVLLTVGEKALASHLAHGDPTSAAVGEVEPNDSISEAQHLDASPCDLPLLVSGTGNGTFDYYSLEVEAGETVVFEITNANFDTEFGLYDEDGNVLARDDDGGAGLFSRIDHTFGTAGTYVIGVGEFNTRPRPGGLTGNVPDPGDEYVMSVER